MKQHTTIKENGWIWPTYGEYTWQHINNNDGLYNSILPLLKKTNTMIQAGGNCGRILKPFIDIFEHIYTFEPDPLNFYCLVQNITNTNVYKFQACLGNSHELVNMKTHYDNDNGAFFIGGPGHIPTFKIDDLNVSECNFIQLDIEGFEYQALLGASKTIETCKPVICVEWFNEWGTRYGVTFNKLDGLIKDFGYKENHRMGSDIIYVPN